MNSRQLSTPKRYQTSEDNYNFMNVQYINKQHVPVIFKQNKEFSDDHYFLRSKVVAMQNKSLDRNSELKHDDYKPSQKYQSIDMKQKPKRLNIYDDLQKYMQLGLLAASRHAKVKDQSASDPNQKRYDFLSVVKASRHQQFKLTPLQTRISTDLKPYNKPIGPVAAKILKPKLTIQTTSQSNQESQVFNRKIRFPIISAKSFVIYDRNKGKIIKKRKSKQKRQVASLTKIMTCYVALMIIDKYNLDPTQIQFKVHKKAVKLRGTSADLEHNDLITLEDLLYGMMLPSGNDAAQVISEGLGHILYLAQHQIPIKNGLYSLQEILDEQKENLAKLGLKYFSCYFIQEMNRRALELDLTQSSFASAHGLANRKNLSSAKDIAFISNAAMKIPKFEKIVNTKIYKSSIRRQEKVTDLIWTTTNKLLDEGFNGVKTGITDAAGPCLAATIENGSSNLIIVVICCDSQDQRFEDVRRLARWSVNQI